MSNKMNIKKVAKYWSIGEFSQITQVTVRALHHYDQIGLLKPALRQDHNNYRVYSETDLVKLQQIVALKYLGFGLTKIKTIMKNQVSIRTQLKQQIGMIEEKITELQHIKNVVTNIHETNEDQPISWQKLIKTMKVFNMMENFIKNIQALRHTHYPHLTNEEFEKFKNGLLQIVESFSKEELKIENEKFKDILGK